MTSNVNDLSARLRRRMEDEDRETTAIAERELRTFGETLNASANDRLRITEAVMQAQTWGVWLHEGEEGTRYVVMPRTKVFPEDWPWTVQGQPAVPLSSE